MRPDAPLWCWSEKRACQRLRRARAWTAVSHLCAWDCEHEGKKRQGQQRMWETQASRPSLWILKKEQEKKTERPALPGCSTGPSTPGSWVRRRQTSGWLPNLHLPAFCSLSLSCTPARQEERSSSWPGPPVSQCPCHHLGGDNPGAPTPTKVPLRGSVGFCPTSQSPFHSCSYFPFIFKLSPSMP